MSDFHILLLTPPVLVFVLVLLVLHFEHRSQHSTMKRLVEVVLFLSLFLLGAFEIFYGAFAGRAGVVTQERVLSQDIHLSDLTPEQIRTFEDHFVTLRCQWGIVTSFGAATSLSVLLCLHYRCWRGKSLRRTTMPDPSIGCKFSAACF